MRRHTIKSREWEIRGREVDVQGTAEWSSRAERGEEGLEVEKPAGQTASQRTMTGGIHRKTARQTIMQIR